MTVGISRRAHEFAVGLNGKLWPMLVGLAICMAVAVWQWVIIVPALDYGGEEDVVFNQTEAKAGEQVLIHFKNVSWHRLYYSELVEQIHCGVLVDGVPKMSKIDLPKYVINVPNERIDGLDKFRAFTVPKECLPGKLTYKAYAQSRVPVFGIWVYTQVPSRKLTLMVVD